MNWGGEEEPFWGGGFKTIFKNVPPPPTPNPTPPPPKTFAKVYGGTGGTESQTLAHISR